MIATNECVELSDLNKSQLNRLNISKSNWNRINKLKYWLKNYYYKGFNYKPKDDHDIQRDHKRRDTSDDPSNGVCLYSNIKLKLDNCFNTYNNCK